MKLKLSDLKLVMDYVLKENPETLEIEESPKTNLGSGINFTFADVEQRQCIITIYQASLNCTPDLQKTMKLYSRVKK